jgi:ribosomal-protein-alanine N-acetyltransferase
MLSERHGGRGYATEAVALALPYAFGELDLHRLETGVQLDNPASMRVLAKNGFREESRCGGSTSPTGGLTASASG